MVTGGHYLLCSGPSAYYSLLLAGPRVKLDLLYKSNIRWLPLHKLRFRFFLLLCYESCSHFSYSFFPLTLCGRIFSRASPLRPVASSSFLASSVVLPFIRASVWARKLASRIYSHIKHTHLQIQSSTVYVIPSVWWATYVCVVLQYVDVQKHIFYSDKVWISLLLSFSCICLRILNYTCQQKVVRVRALWKPDHQLWSS